MKSILLTAKGQMVLRKCLDENKAKYEKASDPALTKIIIKLLEKPEYLNKAKQPLSSTQVIGQIRRIAATLNCGTADLLKYGPQECTRRSKSSSKGKSREKTPSEDGITTDAENEEEDEEEAEDEDRSKTEDDAPLRGSQLSTDKEAVETAKENNDNLRPVYQSDTVTMELSREEARMIALYRNAEDAWGPGIGPSMQYLPGEMEKIGDTCEAAIKSLVADLDIHHLDFSYMPYNCSELGEVIINPKDGTGIGDELFTVYHKNNLSPEIFLRAVAGAAIHKWVLSENLDFDRSSKLAFASMLVDGVLSRDRRDYHENKASLMKALNDLEGLQSSMIRERAEELTDRLLHILLNFRASYQPKEFVKENARSSIFVNYRKIMITAFEHACEVRHTLSKSPGYYEIKFATSGASFDRRWMTRVFDEQCRSDGAEIVGVCVGSAIYGAGEVGGQKHIRVRAQIV